MRTISLKILKILCAVCIIFGVPLLVMGLGTGIVGNGSRGFDLTFHSGYSPERILSWILVAGGPVLIVLFFALNFIYKKLGGDW